MTRRRIGLGILNLAGVLVIAGSCYDLLVPAVPPNHLAYLGNGAGPLPRRFAELDLGMLRAIGGCLLAIGITSLLLTNVPVRRGERWARVAVLVLVGVSESVNSYQMSRFGSPWYGPLAFVALTVLGLALVSTAVPARPLAPFAEKRQIISETGE